MPKSAQRRLTPQPLAAREPSSARRKDGVLRREALLDAAERCFAERGVFGVGIEDIRREAGASPSSVYHQFKGLNEVLLALLLRIFEGLFAHLTARVTRTRSAEGAVKALVDGHLEWAEAHPRRASIMYQAMTLEVGGLGAEGRAVIQARKAELVTPIVLELAPYVERGELPAWSPLLLDVVLLGPAHEAVKRWLGGAAELHPKQLRALLPTVAWKSVRKG